MISPKEAVFFMVKGISRQVILVSSPDKKLFEQAIFILRDDAKEVTEEMLLKEAERAIRFPQVKEKWCGPIWAAAGAAVTGLVWGLSVLL